MQWRMSYCGMTKEETVLRDVMHWYDRIKSHNPDCTIMMWYDFIRLDEGSLVARVAEHLTPNRGSVLGMMFTYWGDGSLIPSCLPGSAELMWSGHKTDRDLFAHLNLATTVLKGQGLAMAFDLASQKQTMIQRFNSEILLCFKNYRFLSTQLHTMRKPSSRLAKGSVKHPPLRFKR